MSASSKKKLRAEQNTAKLTERQLQEQKEAKKTRLYTIAFVVVMIVLVAVAAVSTIQKKIATSGSRELNTVALTVGDHAVSNAELNYYFVDSVNNFFSQNSAYISFLGLDTTKPLNEQYLDEESGTTWADNFLDGAKGSVRSVYAMVDAANAEGFPLPEDAQKQVDSLPDLMKTYAAAYGYNSADAYLKAYYGNGANTKGFQQYMTNNLLASAYQSNYTDNLTYTDADLRAHEAGREIEYNAYSYNLYYLLASRFEPADATDAQKAEAVKAAEEAAKSLTEVKSVAELDQAIAALDINKDSSAKSSEFKNAQYSSMNSFVRDWLSSSARKAGDITYIPSTTTDDAGKETTTGYYVVYFNGTSDNKTDLVNVRHILVSFEGGTTENGSTTYSAEEKAAAKTKAEDLLAQWKSGAATEDSFAELAKQNSSDTGSVADGGLYEDIFPGQMVANFNDWCFNSARKTGDTGVVETEYGYHVIYFVGNGNGTYRDMLITNEMKQDDYNNWYAEHLDNCSVTDGDFSYVRTNLVLNAGR